MHALLSRSRRIPALLVLVLAMSLLMLTAEGAAHAQVPSDCSSDPFVAAQATDASTVYYWNEVLLESFEELDVGPTVLARAAAMMHAGIYDVLNSVFWSQSDGEGCGWSEYLALGQVDPSVDADLAAGYAARDLLIAALPEREALADAAFASRHGTAFQAEARNLATFVVSAVLRARFDDGSDDATEYTPDGVPGSWRATGSTTNTRCTTEADAVDPNWGLVRPFTMTSGSQFRQPLPVGSTDYGSLLLSPGYVADFDEVKLLGDRDAAIHNPPGEQTEIAFFWANDLASTYRPPGQLLEHTQDVAEDQPPAQPTGDPDDFDDQWSQQGIRVARLFAQASLGLADAGIAAWDEKFQTNLDVWRPETAIQLAGTDGNPATVADPDWRPLSRDTDGQSFSPCFPAWVSGHATFAAAWAGVMARTFGDDVTYTVGTQDPNAVGVERTFTSFSQAAEENARSRVFLGVHYQFDADDGLDTGYNLADNLTDNFLTYQESCPATGPCTSELPPASDRISAGLNHTLAVNLDGTVKAWGANSSGQLGNGSILSSSTPVNVFQLDDVIAVEAGSSHSIALKSDGTVWAWGNNHRGQIGDGTELNNRLIPVQVSGIVGATSIAAGFEHSLASTAQGATRAWGDGTMGQLGIGNTRGSNVPVPVDGIAGVVEVAAGPHHSLARRSDGTVSSWGRNRSGELGRSTPLQENEVPGQVPGLSGISQIEGGGVFSGRIIESVGHSISLDADGRVWAWGANGSGQLGDGTFTSRAVPMLVTGFGGARDIGAGGPHSLAALDDGTVRTWGRNSTGQLGNGTTVNAATPVQVTGLDQAVAAVGGGGHSVAATAVGLRAWGANESGQLGDGTTTSSTVPVSVTGSS